jgi:hypothetical protein
MLSVLAKVILFVFSDQLPSPFQPDTSRIKPIMNTKKLPIFTPFRQLLITGFVLFACPGLYGSITGRHRDLRPLTMMVLKAFI